MARTPENLGNELPDELTRFPVVNHRILSVQSHVVSGYVGNRSAVFPLQVLGFDVDFINTVQLSNHTGYPYVAGTSLDEKQLEDLYTGLVNNRLHRRYTHVLTGFVRSKALLEKLAIIIAELKRINPEMLYDNNRIVNVPNINTCVFSVCDPVMGDCGKMYVPENMLDVYRNQILPLADILTPNQFEIELLTGIKIDCEEDAVRALDILHKNKVPNVVISSSELGNSQFLVGFGSCMKNGCMTRFRMSIPKVPATFTGTGDLFAALLLAWNVRTNGNMQRSCEYTVSTLQAVLNRTIEYFRKQDECTDLSICAQNLELRLIQSKKDIENPKLCITCEEM